MSYPRRTLSGFDSRRKGKLKTCAGLFQTSSRVAGAVRPVGTYGYGRGPHAYGWLIPQTMGRLPVRVRAARCFSSGRPSVMYSPRGKSAEVFDG